MPRTIARTGRTQFTNSELTYMHDYLNGYISHAELIKQIKRTRTNSYYYIGRAADYWIQTGVLQFNRSITKSKHLGGVDLDKKNEKRKATPKRAAGKEKK